MNTPSAPELVYDSAGSEPKPSKPILPIRVSGYDLVVDHVELENRGIGGEFSVVGPNPFPLDEIVQVDVSQNCDELRAVGVLGEERFPGPVLTITQ